MDLSLTRNFSQNEKIALLKLIIKIALSDGKITEEERANIDAYLKDNNLKLNENFINNANDENIENILSIFESKTNLCRAQKLAISYAEIHGIDPDFEGCLLEIINESIKNEKKNKKFSITKFAKEIFLEFGYLWGKEDINSTMREVYAFTFTLLACAFGVFYTSGIFVKNTDIAPIKGIHVVCGLLIYGALCFRGYLPKPINFKTILFTAANVFLFTIICTHLFGTSILRILPNFYIITGLILLLWLGIKEVIGFVLIAFFLWFGINIVMASSHISWRAFPFIFFAYMGVSFQSESFFDDFGNLSSSVFKKPNFDKELIKESLEIAGNKTKKAVSTGITAAKMSAGGI